MTDHTANIPAPGRRTFTQRATDDKIICRAREIVCDRYREKILATAANIVADGGDTTATAWAVAEGATTYYYDVLQILTLTGNIDAIDEVGDNASRGNVRGHLATVAFYGYQRDLLNAVASIRSEKESADLTTTVTAIWTEKDNA